MQGLSKELCDELDAFLKKNELHVLYEAYAWENDTYAKGFPDIKRLELQLKKHEASTGIMLDDAVDVAKWGAMRNQRRISGAAVVLPKNTLTATNGSVIPFVEAQPQASIDTLKLIKDTLIKAKKFSNEK